MKTKSHYAPIATLIITFASCNEDQLNSRSTGNSNSNTAIDRNSPSLTREPGTATIPKTNSPEDTQIGKDSKSKVTPTQDAALHNQDDPTPESCPQTFGFLNTTATQRYGLLSTVSRGSNINQNIHFGDGYVEFASIPNISLTTTDILMISTQIEATNDNRNNILEAKIALFAGDQLIAESAGFHIDQQNDHHHPFWLRTFYKPCATDENTTISAKIKFQSAESDNAVPLRVESGYYGYVTIETYQPLPSDLAQPTTLKGLTQFEITRTPLSATVNEIDRVPIVSYRIEMLANPDSTIVLQGQNTTTHQSGPSAEMNGSNIYRNGVYIFDSSNQLSRDTYPSYHPVAFSTKNNSPRTRFITLSNQRFFQYDASQAPSNEVFDLGIHGVHDSRIIGIEPTGGYLAARQYNPLETSTPTKTAQTFFRAPQTPQTSTLPSFGAWSEVGSTLLSLRNGDILFSFDQLELKYNGTLNLNADCTIRSTIYRATDTSRSNPIYSSQGYSSSLYPRRGGIALRSEDFYRSQESGSFRLSSEIKCECSQSTTCPSSADQDQLEIRRLDASPSFFVHTALPMVTGIATLNQWNINAGITDPQDLAVGGQPSSWSIQRSSIRSVVLEFSEPLPTFRWESVRLINLGMNADQDPDREIPLNADHFEMSADNLALKLIFSADELGDGVYELRIGEDFSPNFDGNGDGQPGGEAVIQGNETNRFYRLVADFNGDFGVSVFDFTTYSYWFGESTDRAPEYMDLNQDGGVSVFDFTRYSRSFGSQVVFPQEQD